MENTENTLLTFDDSEVVLNLEDFETAIQPEEVEEVAEESSEEVESTEETNEVDEIVNDPLAQTVYESLVEKGILPKSEEFNGTFEFIDEQMDNLPNVLLKKAIDDLPEHSQQLLKFVAAAGQNLEREELDKFIREFINEQSIPDVTSLDTARAYLETHLKEQGLRPSAIQAQLDDLEDSDELISEAEKLLSKKVKTTDQLIRDKELENKEIQESQKQFFKSVQTSLAETSWSKTQQEKVLQTIPKATSIISEVISKPKAYIQLIDFLEKFNGDEFNIEVYRKQGESRATSTIKDKLEKSGFTSASTKVQSTTGSPDASDSFKDYKLIV